MFHIIYHQGNANQNYNEILLYTSARLARIKNMIPPSADKDMEQQELIHCWWKCEMAATLKYSLVLSYKIKHAFIIQSM